MPDAAGNFRGISIPRIPWLEETENAEEVRQAQAKAMQLHEQLHERVERVVAALERRRETRAGTLGLETQGPEG